MNEEVMQNHLAKSPHAVLEAFFREYRECGDFSRAATSAHGLNWSTTACLEDQRFVDNVVKCLELVFNGGAFPLDSDGVPIHPGDVLIEHEDGHAFVVDGYEYDRVFKKWWVFENNSIRASVGNCTHKAETIESILDEIASKKSISNVNVEEYAARIREVARREEVR